MDAYRQPLVDTARQATVAPGRAPADDAARSGGSVARPNALVIGRGPLGVAVRIENSSEIPMALVLDDRPERLAEPDFSDAWHTWHQLANLAQVPGRVDHLYATTTTLLDAGPSAAADRARTGAGDATRPAGTAAEPALDAAADRRVELSEEWSEAFDEVETVQERSVLTALLEAGAPAPVIGEEFDGVILDIAWEDHKVACVTRHTSSEGRDELVQDGWTLFELEADDLAGALTEAIT